MEQSGEPRRRANSPLALMIGSSAPQSSSFGFQLAYRGHYESPVASQMWIVACTVPHRVKTQNSDELATAKTGVTGAKKNIVAVAAHRHAKPGGSRGGAVNILS